MPNMSGNNKLELNEATMKIAVQEWLERNWINGTPVVDAIDMKSHSGGVRVFEIKLSEPEIEEKKANFPGPDDIPPPNTERTL